VKCGEYQPPIPHTLDPRPAPAGADDSRPGRLPDRPPIELPAPLVFEADLIPLKITISLGEMVDLIPPLRNWETEIEARAFLLGFFNGRRVA